MHDRNPASDPVNVAFPHTGPAAASGPPNICLLYESDVAPLQRFLAGRPADDLYSTTAWHNALAAAGFGKTVYIAAFVGDDVVGVLPVISARAPAGGRRWLSLPGTPAAGIRTDDSVVAWLLTSKAMDIATRRSDLGIWVRHFGATASSRLTPGPQFVLDWVRMPIALLHTTSPTTTTACFEVVPATEALVRRLPRQREGIAPSVLGDLARQPETQLHALLSDAGPSSEPVMVWSRHGQHVHILACGSDSHDDDAFLDWLQIVAASDPAGNACWIDFPCPNRPGRQLATLLCDGETAYACETRLALRESKPAGISISCEPARL